MKKGFFLFLWVLIIVFTIYAAARGLTVAAVAGGLLFVVWAILGAKLNKKHGSDEILNRIRLFRSQENWDGVELVVAPCWFKRLANGLLLSGASYGLLLLVIGTSKGFQDGFKSGLLCIFFCLLCLVVFCMTWFTFAGLIREVKEGFSIRADKLGLHFAGYPVIPWELVQRVGHTWRENKGIVSHFLELELVPNIWQFWVVERHGLFLGPLALLSANLRGVNKLILSGTYLADPVPKIKAAICKIGTRHGSRPVVSLDAGSTLDEALRLDFLRSKFERVKNEANISDEFAKVAAAFQSKQTVNTSQLDIALEKHSEQMEAKSAALIEYARLTTQISTRNSKNVLEEYSKGIKIINWFFACSLIAGVVFLLFKFATVEN